MDGRGEGKVFRRRSRVEAATFVREFEQSGMRRKEFCAARGLTVHTLDAWHRRIAQSGSDERIVPVEIVEDLVASMNSMPALSSN